MAVRRVTFDFETRSASELKRCGAYKYSLHPSTQATCMSFKIRGKRKVYFLPFTTINTHWGKLPVELKTFWLNLITKGFEFSGHNVFFDMCIYKNVLVKRYGWPDIPFRQFRCTAAKAAACALPRNLEGAGAALNLAVQKDKRGYAAMMATCKPTRQWVRWQKAKQQIKDGKTIRKNNFDFAQEPEPPIFLEYKDAPEIWETLYTYCKIDVRTEELLDKTLPDLIPAEQEIWFLNQRLNWQGLRIDIPTVKKIVGIMEAESKVKLKELDSVTMGLVTKAGARKSILDFLAFEGVELPNIRAQTVEDFLKSGKLSEDARRLLEIRKALSKTSTKKYQAFLHRAWTDDRVRDIMLYHGASTGRDTGAGIQPHNFPKGVIQVSKERPYAAIKNVIAFNTEELKFLYGDNLALLFSSILRNVIIPSKGSWLFVGDFSQVEVAVLWWLADNWPGLKVLNQGLDPYKYMAAANTGKTYDEIENEGDDRQLGKAQVLGCGFAMWWPRFQTTAWDYYRLKLTDEQARDAVLNYREENKAVPELWEAYEEAAILALKDAPKVKRAGKCKFFFKDDFLWIELPSGRRLAYRDPQIAWRVREYDIIETDKETGKKSIKHVVTEPRETLEFWAVNSKTKKWSLERTWGGTLTENIVQAVARDLMMPAMLRAEKKGYRPLLSVHDEGICENKREKGSVEEFVSLLCERPKWADEHLPINAKGWAGPRYRK